MVPLHQHAEPGSGVWNFRKIAWETNSCLRSLRRFHSGPYHHVDMVEGVELKHITTKKIETSSASARSSRYLAKMRTELIKKHAKKADSKISLS